MNLIPECQPNMFHNSTDFGVRFKNVFSSWSFCVVCKTSSLLKHQSIYKHVKQKIRMAKSVRETLSIKFLAGLARHNLFTKILRPFLDSFQKCLIKYYTGAIWMLTTPETFKYQTFWSSDFEWLGIQILCTMSNALDWPFKNWTGTSFRAF